MTSSRTGTETGRPALQLTRVDKTYRAATPVHSLRDVTLAVRPGERVAVTGASGSGKTTLMSVMATLERADRGEVSIAGQPTSTLTETQLAGLRAHHIGVVFQRFYLLEALTALDNVATGLLYQGLSGARRRAAARDALARVGLAQRVTHRPAQLSGGEQQRVAIARAAVRRPAVLLADEPTGNLDSAAAAAILELLIDLNRDGTTLIVITHDESVAARMSRRIHLRDGRIDSDEPRR